MELSRDQRQARLGGLLQDLSGRPRRNALLAIINAAESASVTSHWQLIPASKSAQVRKEMLQAYAGARSLPGFRSLITDSLGEVVRLAQMHLQCGGEHRWTTLFCESDRIGVLEASAPLLSVALDALLEFDGNEILMLRADKRSALQIDISELFDVYAYTVDTWIVEETPSSEPGR